MKNIFHALISFLFFLIPLAANAQGYFVAGAGEYLDKSKFKANSQSNLSQYEGKYIGASETYESNFTLIITSNNTSLDIIGISGGV